MVNFLLCANNNFDAADDDRSNTTKGKDNMMSAADVTEVT